MNTKSLSPGVFSIFAACVLLGYSPIASAVQNRTEPPGSTENRDPDEPQESWFSGEAAPEEDTKADTSAEEEIIRGLDPVDPDETRPSPDQSRQDTTTRSASDRCLASTVEAVLEVDSKGRGTALSIDVQDGVVSLTGTLPDQASIEHVRNLLTGVKGVNQVNVSGLTASGSRRDTQ